MMMIMLMMKLSLVVKGDLLGGRKLFNYRQEAPTPSINPRVRLHFMCVKSSLISSLPCLRAGRVSPLRVRL